MTPSQLKTTLALALQNSNPSLHSRLTAQNRLDEYLQPITGRALESIEEARNLAIESSVTAGKPGFVADPMERQQTLNSQFKAAEEVALQQAIEEVQALEAA